MGLDLDNKMEYDLRLSMMLLGTILFNVVILNLITAVYSNEYDALSQRAELLLQKERAIYCCKYLLMLQKRHLGSDQTNNAKVRSILKKACALSLALAATILLLVTFLPQAYTDFMWVSLCFVAAFLMAFAQVTLQMLQMQSDWFQNQSYAKREGPSDDHFLWICSSEGSICDKQDEVQNTVRELHELQNATREVHRELRESLQEVQNTMQEYRGLVENQSRNNQRSQDEMHREISELDAKISLLVKQRPSHRCKPEGLRPGFESEELSMRQGIGQDWGRGSPSSIAGARSNSVGSSRHWNSSGARPAVSAPVSPLGVPRERSLPMHWQSEVLLGRSSGSP
eukprot:gnl/TRDRNA2_/TRDRNA2_155712_c0_seq2.p1 gnl/TRDRNA2_/TRDRNA2_155712_c0~~gnl/TRDRNA2_/TRDRNA2_155712_c0_seq2.p1  ORF type:complete len:392 (-),score=46.79 gnl/TRDRNA2_/TRDRNA2_155712_c0_seq2:144-1166(-)